MPPVALDSGEQRVRVLEPFPKRQEPEHVQFDRERNRKVHPYKDRTIDSRKYHQHRP